METSIIDIPTLKNNLLILNKLYNIVRLVNPIQKTTLNLIYNHLEPTDTACHDFWHQNKICDNCISMRAYEENESFVKIEYNGNRIYMILAIPVFLKEGTAVLELLKDVTDSGIVQIDSRADEKENLSQIVKELNDQLTKDPLTGAFNKKFISERLSVEIVRATANRQPLSVIMCDVDNFKAINDTYGHLAGDEILIKFAMELISSVRQNQDWVARYGGDEFFLCLPDMSKEQAALIAERIRGNIAAITTSYQNRIIRMTGSFGVFTLAANAYEPKDLIHYADQNLYIAKKAGRNQVHSS